jgi:hypothetical protein
MVATQFLYLFQFYMRCGSKGGNFSNYDEPSMNLCDATSKGTHKIVRERERDKWGSGEET